MIFQRKSTAKPIPRNTSQTHAIVIGGSMAGLLTSHVLIEHFDQVTILERDRYPSGPQPRAGLPQDRHVHILLMRGQYILECQFPGLTADLIDEGAHAVDMGQELAVLGYHGWQTRYEAGYIILTFTRPLLDWYVRCRLAQNNHIKIMDGCEVTGLMSRPNFSGITGITYRSRDAGAKDIQTLQADLIVDASGRFSRTPDWLEELGYGRPRESVVNSFLGYSSRLYESPTSFQTDWKALLLLGNPPGETRGGVLLPVEKGRWLITLAGVGKDYPPTGEDGFLEFAHTLRSDKLYHAIRDARPLSPIVGYRATENRLRHYETMADWPEQFVVLGDAVCAFNPIYGQGISIAALGVEILDECLVEQKTPDGFATGLTRQFQHTLARANKVPWLMATGDDFRWSKTEGKRPGFFTDIMYRYLDEVVALATESNVVAATFAQVAHLIKSPYALFHPRISFRVLARIVSKWGEA
jgi:2-polyprenyl-6-methoxyphenol hydroxylase-like FAD-dependent oxidoreductase